MELSKAFFDEHVVDWICYRDGSNWYEIDREILSDEEVDQIREFLCQHEYEEVGTLPRQRFVIKDNKEEEEVE